MRGVMTGELVALSGQADWRARSQARRTHGARSAMTGALTGKVRRVNQWMESWPVL